MRSIRSSIITLVTMSSARMSSTEMRGMMTV